MGGGRLLENSLKPRNTPPWKFRVFENSRTHGSFFVYIFQNYSLFAYPQRTPAFLSRDSLRRIVSFYVALSTIELGGRLSLGDDLNDGKVREGVSLSASRDLSLV